VLAIEDERRRAEDVETGAGEGVVLGELLQQAAVVKIKAKAGGVETGVGGDFGENVLVGDVTLRFVPRLQEGDVKRVEGVVALGTGRLGGPESVEPPAWVVLRLLPDLPVVTFLAVDLFQTEIAPVDGESIAGLFLDLLQPDRCIVDERSEIVEIDFQRHGALRRLACHRVLPVRPPAGCFPGNLPVVTSNCTSDTTPRTSAGSVDTHAAE
jgi:hypothetical protein